MVQLYSESKFCFVPLGNSFASKRLYSVLLSLCVPILVSDCIPLTFPEEVRWHSFSLVINESDILSNAKQSLEEAIQPVLTTPGRLHAMQMNMVKARRHVTYEWVEANGEEQPNQQLYENILRHVEDQHNKVNFGNAKNCPILTGVLLNCTERIGLEFLRARSCVKDVMLHTGST